MESIKITESKKIMKTIKVTKSNKITESIKTFEPNKMHNVTVNVSDFDDDNIIKLLEKLFLYIIKNYPNIELKHGDFIENSVESGNRTSGLYMVNKNNKNKLSIVCLECKFDGYGSVPENFASFVDFEPGYHLEIEIPPECKSYIVNNHVPIPLSFLREQIWIKNDNNKEKVCYLTFNDKKYVLVRENRTYLYTLNKKTIYGEIFLKNKSDFDAYGFSYLQKDAIEEYEKKYGIFDKIILI